MAKRPKPSRWLPLFKEFIREIRISSKEITSVDERGVKLDLWDSQKRFLNEVGQGIDDGIRIFNCLKSRQLGITTISLAIDVFWLAMHPGLTGALVTDTEKNSAANRNTIERYVKSFPEDYFGDSFTIVKSNRQFIQFSNGSRLDLLVAGTKRKAISWGEGIGYAFAHVTEVAAFGDAEGLASFEEAFAQGNPDRLFIFESTAKGFNHWRSKWLAGLTDVTQKSFFCGWWSGDTNIIPRNDPRFTQYGILAASGEERELAAAVAFQFGHKITQEQLAWARWKRATAGAEQDLLDQNQPWTPEQAFVMTGYSFFQTRMIGQDIGRISDDPNLRFQAYRYEIGESLFALKLIPIEDERDRDLIELRIWEEPVSGGEYVLGCDPAYGRNDHKDRHAVAVFRCFADRLVQVAEYATANVEVKHCAWVLAHLAGAYRDCILNVEIGGPGRMIMQEWEHLRGTLNAEMNVRFVEGTDWDDAMGNARWYLYHKPDSMGKGYAMNFETTWRTKQELMHQMRGAYVTKELDIRSIPLLKEMQIVVQNGSEIGAPESRAENSKDDRVFATALATKAWLEWRRPTLIAHGKTYTQVMLDESGEQTALGRSINSLVFRFLKTAEERANEPADESTHWRTERGFR